MGRRMGAKYDCYIGIDPDVKESGVATYVKGNDLLLDCFTFFDLFSYLLAQTRINEDYNICVVIEAGWLNKGNWHTVSNKSKSHSAKIGGYVGANHAVGKKIVEMCEYLEIDFELVKPTRSKVNAATFKETTGYQKRTNPEKRDAGMLVYGR